MADEKNEQQQPKPKNTKLVKLITVVTVLAFAISLYDFAILTGMADNLNTLNQQVATLLPQNTTQPTTVKTVALGTNPVEGDANAKITIVEFSDFQCPFCGAAEGTNQAVITQLQQQDSAWTAPIPGIVTNYISTGKAKLYYRNFPLTQIHQYAYNASIAAECANEQNKFWAYHDKLFNNQDSLTVANLEQYAAGLGLNTAQFNSCLESGKYASTISTDQADGTKYGVQGTPTFFIGTPDKGYQIVVGAEPYNQIKTILDSYA